MISESILAEKYEFWLDIWLKNMILELKSTLESTETTVPKSVMSGRVLFIIVPWKNRLKVSIPDFESSRQDLLIPHG